MSASDRETCVYSLRAAARVLGCSPRTIRSAIDEGRLPAARYGDKRLSIAADDLERFRASAIVRPHPVATRDPDPLDHHLDELEARRARRKRST